MLLAGAIFVLTIVLVIWQPKGLGIPDKYLLARECKLICALD